MGNTPFQELNTKKMSKNSYFVTTQSTGRKIIRFGISSVQNPLHVQRVQLKAKNFVIQSRHHDSFFLYLSQSLIFYFSFVSYLILKWFY